LVTVLALSSAGVDGGCVGEVQGLDDPEIVEDPASGPVEQASTPLVLVLRSVSVPDQVVDTLFPQSGALVRLGPASITSQQRWQLSDLQLRHYTAPSLRLEPEAVVAGARLILRPCVAPPTPGSGKTWLGHLDSQGRVSWRNSATELWMDASAGAFGVLPFRPATAQAQCRLPTL
jgi:hypothetical protein